MFLPHQPRGQQVRERQPGVVGARGDALQEVVGGREARGGRGGGRREHWRLLLRARALVHVVYLTHELQAVATDNISALEIHTSLPISFLLGYFF